MRLEHVGIASSNVAAALHTLFLLLGRDPYKAETVEREGVRTHFLDAGAKLELLEALDPDSPVAKFLEKRGDGLHHLAFGVDDVDATFERLKKAGLPLLADAPKPGADGKRIFFVHPKATHGVLVEFCGDDDRLPEARPLKTATGRFDMYRFGRPDRETVVVLPDEGRSAARDALPLCRALEPAFHVVLLDMGGETAPERVVPAVEALGIATVHAVGVGAGGAAALGLAANAPACVARVAVYGASVEPFRPPMAGLLGSVRAPVLVAGGDDDAALPPERLIALRGALPDARLCVLPGVGSVLTAAVAHALAPHVIAFLRG
jgi:methylmalonyl-CoA epimerase